MKRTRTTTVVAFAAVFAAFAFVPAMALGQGNVVKDLVKGVQGILDGAGGGGGAAQPQAGSPPNYTPPLHGSNPHGQGDVATVDLTPDNALPQPGGIDEGETVTVGQSRGEQDANGNYHGRVVLLDENLINLVNVSVETDEGEQSNGPLDLQDLLNALCNGTGLGGDNCVEVAAVNSDTSPNGSNNSFELAGTNIGLLNLATVDTSTAATSGNINETSDCQTSEGTSTVNQSEVALGGQEISADVLTAESESVACNDGTQSVQQDSQVASLNGGPVLSLLPGFGDFAQDCEDGDANTSFVPLAPLVSLVCNADDRNSGQTSAPYGVREALSVFVLAVLGGDPVIKVVTAGPETHAVPPGDDGSPPNPPTGGGGGGEGDDNPNDGGGNAEDDGPAAGAAQAGDGRLAFTGTNMLVLALIGAMLIIGGLGLARASTRRHSRAAA